MIAIKSIKVKIDIEVDNGITHSPPYIFIDRHRSTTRHCYWTAIVRLSSNAGTV